MVGAEGSAERDAARAWLELADVALRRMAVRHRLARGRALDEGVDIGDVDAALAAMTGHGDADRLDDAARTLDPLLADAEARFRASLDVPHAFSSICANADLDVAEAEVLAVALAVELDVGRQRLVAYVNDDQSRPRLTLQSIGGLFGDGHPGAVAVGHDVGPAPRRPRRRARRRSVGDPHRDAPRQRRVGARRGRVARS